MTKKKKAREESDDEEEVEVKKKKKVKVDEEEEKLNQIVIKYINFINKLKEIFSINLIYNNRKNISK